MYVTSNSIIKPRTSWHWQFSHSAAEISRPGLSSMVDDQIAASIITMGPKCTPLAPKPHTFTMFIVNCTNSPALPPQRGVGVQMQALFQVTLNLSYMNELSRPVLFTSSTCTLHPPLSKQAQIAHRSHSKPIPHTPSIQSLQCTLP